MPKCYLSLNYESKLLLMLYFVKFVILSKAKLATSIKFKNFFHVYIFIAYCIIVHLKYNSS